MGKTVIPAGGLPAAVKAQLTPENIKMGVQLQGSGLDVTGIFTGDATAGPGDILVGKTAGAGGEMIVGTIPVQTGYSKTIPMYSTAAVTLPAGYYAQAITITPTYQNGTVITNFSAAGPLGAVSTYGGVTEYYAENGRAYIRHYEHNGSGSEQYGGSGAIGFALPIVSGFRRAVISGTYHGLVRIGFGDNPSSIAVRNQYENYASSNTFSADITMGTHRYFRLEAHISILQPWASGNPWVNVTKITLYT